MIGLRIFYLYIFFFFIFLFVFPSHPDVEWYLLLLFCFGHPVLILSIFEGFDSVNLWLPSLLFWIAFFYIVISYFKDLKRKNSNKHIFANEYRIRDNAIKEIRSMYLNGRSPLEMLQYIRDNDLILPNSDLNASRLFIECFCLEIGYSKIAEDILTSKDLNIEKMSGYNGILKKGIESRIFKWYENLHFSQRDNALEEVRSMYLNGSSALDILQYIRASDLISPNNDRNASRFFIECFCLRLELSIEAHTLLSPTMGNPRHRQYYNIVLTEEIELRKPKWSI